MNRFEASGWHMKSRERHYTYDLNGNQTGWSVADEDDPAPTCPVSDDDFYEDDDNRLIQWDEENRMQAVGEADEDDLTVFDDDEPLRFKYDDAGERVVKYTDDDETIYVNQFLTLRDREAATKHIFAGGTRLASKMASQPDVTPPTAGNSGQAPWGWLHSNAGGNSPNAGGTVFEKDQYYFHPDHLGSSSYVTDIDGEIFQHLEYFPFGETFVEESSNTQRTPYLFTGKELDEETGLYYFGARYYDPRTSLWQSPDPILASYMGGKGSGGGVFTPRNLSLYAYSHQRPVMMSDPDGKETMITINEKARTIDIVVTVAWDGDSRLGYRFTDAEIAAEFEGQSRIYSSVITKSNPKGAAFDVTFDVQFVKDASTLYDIRMIPVTDESGDPNRSSVTGGFFSDAERGGKLMQIVANRNLKTFKHELNHFAGAKDRYRNGYLKAPDGSYLRTPGGKRRRGSVPRSGWEGNVMANSQTGVLNSGNVSQMILSGSGGSAALSNGVAVIYDE